MNRLGLLAVGLLLVASSGCATTAMPSWSHPGPDAVQRRRALQYDPYPEAEIGPSVEGLRPREYDKPPPEASRGRWFLGNWDKQ